MQIRKAGFFPSYSSFTGSVCRRGSMIDNDSPWREARPCCFQHLVHGSIVFQGDMNNVCSLHSLSNILKRLYALSFDRCRFGECSVPDLYGMPLFAECLYKIGSQK